MGGGDLGHRRADPAVGDEDRRPRQEGDVPVAAGVEHGVTVAIAGVVAVLDRHHSAQCLGEGELVDGHVGDADVTDLAGLLELDERTDRLVVRHARVRRVHLVQVDGVDAQAPQTLVAFLPDVVRVARRRQGHVPLEDLCRLEPGLGGDDEVLGIGVQRLGDDLLRLAVAVDVRRVDEVDAAIDDAADQPAGLIAVTGAVGVAGAGDAHGTEAEAPDGEVATDGERADGVVGEHSAGHRRHSERRTVMTTVDLDPVAVDVAGLVGAQVHDRRGDLAGLAHPRRRHAGLLDHEVTASAQAS